jgi:hypothetical protein
LSRVGRPNLALIILPAYSHYTDQKPAADLLWRGRKPLPPSAPVSINYRGCRWTRLRTPCSAPPRCKMRGGILARKHQKMSGRPVTPLHKGHVGLLACSGMLNGSFGEGESRHIAHWRSVKYVDESTRKANRRAKR